VRGYDANAVFDWTQDHYPFYIIGLGFHPMPSPWVDYANNFNLGDFQYTGRANYAPEYGWVLVKKDFGTLGFPIEHPYLILYNKFRGTLRIFVAITSQQGTAQKAVFKVWFPSESGNKTPYKSGIFEFNRAENSFNALDKFDNQIPFMKTSNEYAHALPYWLYTDIATAYDPCTCNYSSKFAFDVELINTTNLQFTANGNIVQQIDSTGAGGGGRQNLLQIGTGAVAAGTSYHGIATNGISAIDSIFHTVTKSPFIKNWIPGLAAAVGVLDFLSGAFGETTPPQPMAFKMDLQATGSLVTNLPHKQQNTDVPGTEHIGRPLIPIHYDNVMGVYNLLETPKAFWYRQTDYGNGSSHSVGVRIPNSIKYVLNPNAEIDLDKFDIYGAIELEVSNSPYPHIDVTSSTPNVFKIKDLEPNKQLWRSTTYPLASLKGVVVSLTSDINAMPIPRSNSLKIERSYLRLTLKHKRSITPTEEMEEIHIGRFLLDQEKYLGSTFYPGDEPLFNPPNKVELQEMQDNAWLNYLNNPLIIPAGTTKTVYASTSIFIANLQVIGGGILRIMTGTPSQTNPNFPNFQTSSGDVLDILEQNGQIEYAVGVPDLIKGLLPPVSDADKGKPVSAFCSNSVYINRAKNFEANKDEDLSTSVVASSIPKSDNLTIYPNPTATDATFSYAIAKAGATKITVTNMLGIVVSELVHVENHEIGSFEVNLNTQNLPSGIYLCVLQTVEGVQTQKLVVNK
jgi:hypothetical protein